MIPVYVPCSACCGDCHIDVQVGSATERVRCRSCDGLGRQWAPGAPAYDCTITVADREPGEIVTLGNGQRAKILWHLPYKRERGEPHTTFLDILTEFYEAETHIPVPYPSCIGVASVDEARVAVTEREGKHTQDLNDPMQRRASALL